MFSYCLGHMKPPPVAHRILSVMALVTAIVTGGAIDREAAAGGEEALEVRWQKRLDGAIRGIGSNGDMLFAGNFDGQLFGLRRREAGD